MFNSDIAMLCKSYETNETMLKNQIATGNTNTSHYGESDTLTNLESIAKSQGKPSFLGDMKVNVLTDYAN